MKSLKRWMFMLSFLALGGISLATGCSDDEPAPADQVNAADTLGEEAGAAITSVINAVTSASTSGLTAATQTDGLSCADGTCTFTNFKTGNQATINGTASLSGTSITLDLTIAFDSSSIKCTITVTGTTSQSDFNLSWSTSDACTVNGTDVGGSSCETTGSDACTTCSLPGGAYDDCAEDDDDGKNGGGTGDLFADCNTQSSNACASYICAYKASYDFCVDNGGQDCESFYNCVEDFYTCICPGGNITTDTEKFQTCSTQAEACDAGGQ